MDRRYPDSPDDHVELSDVQEVSFYLEHFVNDQFAFRAKITLSRYLDYPVATLSWVWELAHGRIIPIPAKIKRRVESLLKQSPGKTRRWRQPIPPFWSHDDSPHLATGPILPMRRSLIRTTRYLSAVADGSFYGVYDWAEILHDSRIYLLSEAVSFETWCRNIRIYFIRRKGVLLNEPGVFPQWWVSPVRHFIESHRIAQAIDDGHVDQPRFPIIRHFHPHDGKIKKN